MGPEHERPSRATVSLHRTKVAVRDMADRLYRSGPITLSGIEYSKVLGALQQSSAAFVAAVVRQILYRARAEQAAVAQKAWHATIEYFAVMEATRATDILNTLVPGGIRVTTRPKAGQIGVHTSDQNSPSLFSYHSVPVIILCDKGKRVKIDFQLRLHALTGGYRPVLLHGTETVGYLHPDVPLGPIDALPWKRGS